MGIITANELSSAKMDMRHPTTLYAANGHSIFWLGNTDETAFHGSITGPQHVALALDYLRNLRCGTDIIYADIESNHDG